MRSATDILQGEDLGAFLESCSCQRYEQTKDIGCFQKFVERLLGLEAKEYHLEWVRMFYDNKRTCIMAYRGAAKTTVLGAAFNLWVSMFKENNISLIVSANMRESLKIISIIRGMINSNEILYQLKPEGREKTWSKQELDLANGSKIICRPYTINIRGAHVNYILADEASLYQDLSIFTGSISPMVNHKEGHMMVIGTPINEVDLIARLNSDPNMGYTCKTYEIFDELGKSRWPEKFPLERIEEIRRETNALDFAREYLCKIVSDESQIFSSAVLVKSFNINEEFESKSDNQSPYYIGVDLALSPEGDYSVFTVVKKDTNVIKLVHIRRQRGLDYKLQAQIIKELYDVYKPKTLLIDESVFGNVLIDDLRMNYMVPADGMKFTPINRIGIVDNLRRLFEGGMISIPRKNSGETLTLTDELVKELSRIVVSKTKTGMQTYRSVGMHDDMCMSFALACSAASQHVEVDTVPVSFF